MNSQLAWETVAADRRDIQDNALRGICVNLAPEYATGFVRVLRVTSDPKIWTFYVHSPEKRFWWSDVAPTWRELDTFKSADDALAAALWYASSMISRRRATMLNYWQDGERSPVNGFGLHWQH